MSKYVKPLRSASLIITRTKKSQTSFFDYEILMMKKKARPPWGSALVFPGGLYDAHHDNYLKQKFSFSSALEATAIRECFEEAGLFFTQKPIIETQKLNQLSKIRLQYISRCLNRMGDYKQVSRNQIQKLGQILGIQRQILRFIRLITIPELPSRFDTTFFLHKLEDYRFINFLKFSEHQKYIHQSQDIVKCDNQFEKFRWMNPADILSEFFRKELILAPPQYMIINIMLKFYKHRELESYLSQSYIQDDEFGNISLGPNIVSMIQNNHSNIGKPYRFAATLLGDEQFPYKQHIQKQCCPELKQELRKWQENRNMVEEGKNRLLFNESKKLFQQGYQVQCQLKRSNLRKMMGHRQTQAMLKKEVAM